MSEEYRLVAIGKKQGDSWQGTFDHNGVRFKKTIATGPNPEIRVAQQFNPDTDLQGDPPVPEMRRVFTIAGDHVEVVDPQTGEAVEVWTPTGVDVSEWPIDAFNYPETITGIEAAITNMDASASAKTVIEKMAKMIMYLYLESKL